MYECKMLQQLLQEYLCVKNLEKNAMYESGLFSQNFFRETSILTAKSKKTNGSHNGQVPENIHQKQFQGSGLVL